LKFYGYRFRILNSIRLTLPVTRGHPSPKALLRSIL